MSDTYEIIGMTIVGLVVLGITSAAVKFGYTNSISEKGNNASGVIQGNEPWENIYSNRSDATQETPDSDVEEDEADKNPVMKFEGGSRKRKLTKYKKSKKHRKSQKKHKRRNK